MVKRVCVCVCMCDHTGGADGVAVVGIKPSGENVELEAGRLAVQVVHLVVERCRRLVVAIVDDGSCRRR